MNELDKMLAGKLYDSSDKEIQVIARKAHKLCLEYNSLEDTNPRRKEILKELLPDSGPNIYLQGDIYFDYGIFTHIGNNFYANYGLRVLDTCPIYIGDRVFFGCGVTLATPLHPLLGKERSKHSIGDKDVYFEYGKPIHIGNDVWFGCNVTVCPGVKIGDNVVIGAGSVVTRDIPSNSLAFGNPCKVSRSLTEEDSIYLKKELFE